MATFRDYTPEDVCLYIKEKVSTIFDGVLKNIVAEKIDGEVLLEMDDDSLREVAPLVGDRLKIKKAISKAYLSAPIVSYTQMVRSI